MKLLIQIPIFISQSIAESNLIFNIIKINLDRRHFETSVYCFSPKNTKNTQKSDYKSSTLIKWNKKKIESSSDIHYFYEHIHFFDVSQSVEIE